MITIRAHWAICLAFSQGGMLAFFYNQTKHTFFILSLTIIYILLTSIFINIFIKKKFRRTNNMLRAARIAITIKRTCIFCFNFDTKHGYVTAYLTVIVLPVPSIRLVISIPQMELQPSIISLMFEEDINFLYLNNVEIKIRWRNNMI